MKRIFIFILTIFSAFTIIDQNTKENNSCSDLEYNYIIAEADALANGKVTESSLTQAIKLYRAAQACRPEKRQDVNNKLDAVYIKIGGLNSSLLRQMRETEKAIQVAETNRLIAVKKAHLAELQAKRAEQEKRTSDLAAQALIAKMYNYTHAYQLADSACEVSNYLNQVATDVRKTLWSDHQRLFYKKSFFHCLKSGIRQLAVSHNGKYIAAGFDNGDIIYWDIETGEEQMKTANFPAAVTGIGLSDNGVLAFAQGSQLMLKDPKRMLFYNNATPIQSVCISRDSRFVVFSGAASAGSNANLRWAGVLDILSLPEGRGFGDQLHNIGDNIPGVRQAIFAKDNRLATAGEDHLGRVYRYDPATNNFVQTIALKGHTAPLHSIVGPHAPPTPHRKSAPSRISPL
jgi:hypothetical protein